VTLEKVPRAAVAARSEATAKTKTKVESGQRRSAANELECAALNLVDFGLDLGGPL
jgi:hypothetical protein